MKLRITSVILLLLCFLLLAVLVGAIPVLTIAEASSDAAVSSPAPAESASPAPTPDPTPTPSPEPTPESTPDPVSEPEGGVRVIPTTIAAGDLLDNDTYYEIDPEALLEEGLSLSLPAEGYQILIIHTHATEAYMPDGTDEYEQSDDYRTTDPEYSVVRVGEELARTLADYGLNVLHDTALHDYPSYNGSYARSGEAIEEYLEAYPGIGVVIDLHRDALGDDDVMYKTVAEADGTEAAQMMFVMGSDVNLDHPRWRENLKLALTLQNAVRERWPELMRPTVLCDYRYNQQLTDGSLLLEVGTSGNSLAEALVSARLFAEAAGPILASLVAE